MSRRVKPVVRPQLESLESRDVPSAAETTFSVTLPDSTTVTGEFSTPGTLDPTVAYESLTLSNLAVKINGETASISAHPRPNMPMATFLA